MEMLERQIIQLIATDRIHVPISSMSGKLKRIEPKLAKAVDLSDYDGSFIGKRVYARVETDDTTMKARTMADAIKQFEGEYPRHGKILVGMIEEERAAKETYLYFGVNSGCKLTADDYMGVMTNLGLSESTVRGLYPELMEISRRMAKKRDEERSVMIG